MNAPQSSPSATSAPAGAEPRRHRVLVLDDETGLQRLLKTILEGEGHEVLVTDDGRAALEMIGEHGVELVIQDLRMSKLDGLTFLRQLKERHPDVPSIVITAFGTLETAVEAMRLGAYTHLSKPFDTEELRLTVSRALERIELQKKSPRSNAPFVDMVSNTSAMSAVASLIEKVAATDSTILISGESGTGKELVARSIHYGSMRCDQPFVPVNCGAFTETLLESELFGHVKGAFTNAIADHQGVFERADRGTLFLDEVGELSLTTQVKLLRVLETRTFKPVGSNREMRVDVRFITATHRDLSQLVAQRQFRDDLFYRLNVFPIHLPPLRDRKEDIPLLAGHFLARLVKRMNKRITAIDDNVIERLMAYAWPGNIRELENTIERAVVLARGERVTLADIFVPTAGATSGVATAVSLAPVNQLGRRSGIEDRGSSTELKSESSGRPPTPDLRLPTTVPVVVPAEGMDLEQFLLQQERSCIIQALERSNWNLTEAAKILNMTFRSIRYRVQKLGIEKPDRGLDIAEE